MVVSQLTELVTCAYLVWFWIDCKWLGAGKNVVSYDGLAQNCMAHLRALVGQR